MKYGNYAIDLDCVVLGQLVPVNNPLEDLGNFEVKPNEGFISLPRYNTANSLFQGIKKWLTYIMIRGHFDEIFYSYGFDEEKSKILYSAHKLRLPNIIKEPLLKNITAC